VAQMTPEACAQMAKKINEYAEKKEWLTAIESPGFRAFKGTPFKLDDVDYFRLFVRTWDADIAGRVGFCLIQHAETFEKNCLKDVTQAEYFINNFLIALYFAGYLYKDFPKEPRIFRNLLYINYKLYQESGLVLFNACKKFGFKELESIVLGLRRTSFTKTRDLYLRYLAEYPDDHKARFRLQKIIKQGPQNF